MIPKTTQDNSPEHDEMVIIGRLKEELREERERAQKLVDDVGRIREIIKGLTAAETHRFPTLEMLDNELKKVLQQWKGKEVEG